MRSLHRKLAWIAGLVAPLWAATGFLHPIMSWTAPRPAAMGPPHPALSLEHVKAPGPLLTAHGWRQANSVRLVEIEGAPFWLAFGAGGETLALNARTGETDANAERAYAVILARHYSGKTDAPLASAERFTRFSLFYPSINHVLPVWDVKFADGLDVYVDPRADRMVTMADGTRRLLLFVFQNVHTLTFLSGVEPIRKFLIAALIAMTIATALFGIVMSVNAKGRKIRAAHRIVGLIGGPLLLCFAGSGLFHLLAARPAASTEAAPFFVAGLEAPRLAGLVQSVGATGTPDGHAIWRAASSGQAAYFNADGRFVPLDDPSRAREIAGADANALTHIVTQFSAEYSFANKRLPVWRVARENGAVFADVQEGLIAADAPRALEAADGWSFNIIHKWRFLDPIGKLNRDLLMMLAVLLIATTAMMGLMLKRKPQTQREKLA